MMIAITTYRPIKPPILSVEDRYRRCARIRVFDARTRLKSLLAAEPEIDEPYVGNDCDEDSVIFTHDGATRSFLHNPDYGR